jgi:hypothetical protein
MTIYFAAIGSGLGDIIVSLPILHQLIATAEPTYLIARSPRQENLEPLLPGLAGTIREPDFDETTAEGRYYNFRSHPIQLNYDWSSAEFEQAFPGIRIDEILKIICRDFELPVDCHKPLEPLAHRFLPERSDSIVFIPGTVVDTKCWPVSNWYKCYESLDKMGAKVLMIGEPERCPLVHQLKDLGIPWIATPRIVDVLDTVSSCKAVVSVDTGIMHLAVQQGKPTVALFEKSPLYYRKYPNCWPLFAAPCQKECTDEMSRTVDRGKDSKQWVWYQGKFERCKASEELKCMSFISPDAVLETLSNPGAGAHFAAGACSYRS